MRKLNALGLTALTLVAMGCDDDRTSVLEPVGPIAIGAAVGPAIARVPSASVAVGAAATVTASNLRAVTGASYHFWYVSQDAATGADVYTAAYGTILEFFQRDSLSGGTSGTPVSDPITGEVIQVEDTNVVAATRTGSYAGTDAEEVYAIEFVLDSAADVGTTTPATGRNAVVVSLGAGTTSDAQFLFRRIGVAGGGAMTLGNFGGADVIAATNPADYAYSPGGSGNAYFRGTEVVVNMRELRRPPEGFYYAGYLVDTAGTTVLVDTLRSAYSAIASESRVSMYDADVDGQLPGIAVTAITHSQVRNCASGATVAGCANTLGLPATDTFAGQLRFILTLAPKGSAATRGNTVVLAGDIPDRVW